MDDDCKDFKRGKPHQKLYKPGSGPLRRSDNGSDSKMDLNDISNCSRSRDTSIGSSQNDEYSCNKDQYITSIRSKKPEQQLYVPRSGDMGPDNDKQLKQGSKNDTMSGQYNNRRPSSNKMDKHSANSGTGPYSVSASRREFNSRERSSDYNRHSRHISEPRSVTPTHCGQERSTTERNRDSRSMETGQHALSTGAKPPSGRRNSAGHPADLPRPKYINLDNMPPRFRKKFLEQSGYHSFDSVDQINKDKSYMSHSNVQNLNYNTNPNWSQTLPSRGRGRLRDNENFDREKFLNSYFKNSDIDNSRRSTPSSSYMNLYSLSKNMHDNTDHDTYASTQNHNEIVNGISELANNILTYNNEEAETSVTDNNDDESVSCSTNLDNLDWTEEVEKNIKLDDTCDTSFSQSFKTSSVSQEVKPVDSREPKKSGRSGRRRDKRSLSRGKRNSEKRDRNRKDSVVSVQEEISNNNIKHFERERRDSHRSNRSSTIGNSRDDLDRWRSLRSYSREQSTEGRIVSQCNSRDTSISRALSPRDSDGFRVPSTVSKPLWSNNQKKNNASNGAWIGRNPSAERGRKSPAPSIDAGDGAASGAGPGAGGRRGRKGRSGRRRGRHGAGDIAPPGPHPPGATPAPTNVNWREEILESKKHHERHPEVTNQRSKLNSNTSERSQPESSTLPPGLIILPQNSIPDLHKDQGRGGAVEVQKLLYDHNNPSKPIVVQTSHNKMDMRMERESGRGVDACGERVEKAERGERAEGGEAARAARHRALLQEVERADAVLQAHSLRGPLALADHWPDVQDNRKFLQNALQKLLMSDLKYCQADNIEHNFWKMLYYQFIEVLRNSLTQISPEEKPKVVKLINTIIEEGNVFFENLVHLLEKSYKFNAEDYINDNHILPPKGLGYVGLALISVQKLYIFLGDLARYKEQVNGTHNYAKSKFWYTKAQQINPKNGRPYNQLAILAIYARRKLDAVYYYMRSLMSSNPFQSARESLLSLFDENRKKYEAAEKKRRAAQGVTPEESAGGAGGAGREVWVRAGGRPAARGEDLENMTPVELNKNFITSYLHVHGKLITKIGMETFHESAKQMLQQFRALLHRQPLPTPAARLLQLTALNMFAVETTAVSTKDKSGGSRSAWVECAVGVSLLMFGALLERCCALLPEPPHSQHYADALLLLPAVKVWSDWMLCHSSIWNPPPSFEHFKIESDHDPWDWLAKLMNILEDLDDKNIALENGAKEGLVMVRLSEDSSLAGFTPLMYMEPAVAWAPLRARAAEHALRTRKLLFFGTEYLVGVEPPVLRLECPPEGAPRYVSAVLHAHHHPPLHHLCEDSEGEERATGSVAGAAGVPGVTGGGGAGGEADAATRRLLLRRHQLECTRNDLEKRRQQMQEMLHGAGAGGAVEVRPRWLVPDTNCFIEHLALLQAVADAPTHPYVLAIPLVVVSELEGLRKCSRRGESARTALEWAAAASAAGGAGAAGGAVRFATSRGSLLPTAAFAERDALAPRATNDDRVLATALTLHHNLTDESKEKSSGEARRVREVVLLSEDRNLRVKALAAELPTRDLPSFVRWAGLLLPPTPQSNEESAVRK